MLFDMGPDCSRHFPSDERVCVLHFTELWLFIHRGQTQPREKFHKHNTLSDKRDENQIWQSHKAFSLQHKQCFSCRDIAWLLYAHFYKTMMSTGIFSANNTFELHKCLNHLCILKTCRRVKTK